MTDRLMGDEELVILVDEDGGEHEFYLVDTMEVEGNRYAILLPSEEDEEDEGEVIILKIGKDQDGSEVYFEIEEDEEWEKVADAWEESANEEDPEAVAKVLSPGLVVTVNSSNGDKKCPACNTALKEGTKATACPTCKTVHHKECWQEGGCAKDGCEG